MLYKYNINSPILLLLLQIIILMMIIIIKTTQIIIIRYATQIVLINLNISLSK